MDEYCKIKYLSFECYNSCVKYSVQLKNTVMGFSSMTVFFGEIIDPRGNN